MKRYPLQTLIQLREHRTGLAQRALLAAQREAQRCRDTCMRIEREIIAIESERSRQRAHLLDQPPPGAPWPVVLAQREAHIDWLGEQAEVARARLRAAQETLRAAERALEDARSAFFRAKARQDALEKRKDVWRGEQLSLDERREENAAAEAVQAGHLRHQRNATVH